MSEKCKQTSLLALHVMRSGITYLWDANERALNHKW